MKKVNSTFNSKVLQLVERRALNRSNRSCWAARRRIISLVVRDGKWCTHCLQPVKFLWESGMRPTSHNVATFDHVKTKDKGGFRQLDNGVLACYLCNNLRGNKTVAKYQKQLAAVGGDPLILKARREEAKKDLQSEKAAWLKQRYYLERVLLQFDSIDRNTPLDNFIFWLTSWRCYVTMR